MALRFDGSTAKLVGVGGAVQAYPLSISCWARPDNTGTNKAMVSIGNATNDNHVTLYAPSSEVVAVLFRLNEAVDRSILGSGALSATQFTHCGASIDSSRVPRVYKSGVLNATGTDGGAGTFAAMTRTIIGARSVATPDFHMSGDVAHVATWSRMLNDAEWSALGNRQWPESLAEGLTFYVSLLGDPYDQRAMQIPFTRTGVEVAAHPPGIMQPRRRRWITVASTVSADMTLTAAGAGSAAFLSPGQAGFAAASLLNPTLN